MSGLAVAAIGAVTLYAAVSFAGVLGHRNHLRAQAVRNALSFLSSPSNYQPQVSAEVQALDLKCQGGSWIIEAVSQPLVPPPTVIDAICSSSLQRIRIICSPSGHLGVIVQHRSGRWLTRDVDR